MRIVATAFVATAACLAGCAAPPLAPGQSETDVLDRLGPPTAIYAMPDGNTRLEYAAGPFGRTTWMIDLDHDHRVVAARQVLGEATFSEFQAKGPGMSREQLLRTLGTPGERRSGGRQGGEVWSWRYPTNDCLWFQVSLRDDGVVRDGTYGIDPHCDAGDEKH